MEHPQLPTARANAIPALQMSTLNVEGPSRLPGAPGWSPKCVPKLTLGQAALSASLSPSGVVEDQLRDSAGFSSSPMVKTLPLQGGTGLTPNLGT